jgi:hypothetical protein
MLGEMAGVIAAHEAGIGFLAERTGKHPAVESGGFGLVNAVLSAAGIAFGQSGQQ